MRWFVLWMGLTGCATEVGIQDKWDRFVEENSTCEVAEDCATAFAQCPLGCYAAVQVDAVDEAESYADELVSRYERTGRSCAYDCIEPPELECVDSRCQHAEE